MGNNQNVHLFVVYFGFCFRHTLGSDRPNGMSSAAAVCVLQVSSKYIAEDLVEDFDAGLEYAEADCILDVQQKGDSLQYFIR